MIETPEITGSAAQPPAGIRLTIPRAEIKTAMGPAIGEATATAAAQGMAPAGPVFAHHLAMNPETLDFEVGVPVATRISPAGRVKPGGIPAATVARTVYHGGYEGLAAAWEEFDAWIAASGYKPGPESSSDPAKWRTELNRPLAG